MSRCVQTFDWYCKYSDPLLNTLLKHLWQRLQPWAFLVWCYKLDTSVFGEFLPFFSADPLKLCQVVWGVSLHSYFQVSSEMFDQVEVWALAGPLKDIQRLVPKPLLHCLGCVLRVIALLEGKPSPSLRSWALWNTLLCSIHLFLYLD